MEQENLWVNTESILGVVVTEEMIADAPLWCRVELVLKSICGLNDHEINWDEVNKNLFTKLSRSDYNITSSVKSVSELEGLRFDVISAGADVGPWRKRDCKSCGKEFYLTKSEVDYFLARRLALPKRCMYCRKGIT